MYGKKGKKRGKETSGRDRENVEKKAPHTTHKRMKIFFLKSDPGDGQKQDFSTINAIIVLISDKLYLPL